MGGGVAGDVGVRPNRRSRTLAEGRPVVGLQKICEDAREEGLAFETVKVQVGEVELLHVELKVLQWSKRSSGALSIEVSDRDASRHVDRASVGASFRSASNTTREGELDPRLVHRKVSRLSGMMVTAASGCRCPSCHPAGWPPALAPWWCTSAA